jgi:hypothetical protein
MVQQVLVFQENRAPNPPPSTSQTPVPSPAASDPLLTQAPALPAELSRQQDPHEITLPGGQEDNQDDSKKPKKPKKPRDDQAKDNQPESEGDDS